MKNFFVRFVVLLACSSLFFQINAWSSPAQDTSGMLIPIYLQLWHDHITVQQNVALGLDGKKDHEVTVSGDPEISKKITHAFTTEVNELRKSIEFSDMDKRHKILYLNSIYAMLREFNNERRYGKIEVKLAPALIQNFKDMFHADRKGESIAGFVKSVPYAIGAINVSVFSQNYGYREARSYLLRNYAKEHPESFLNTLNKYYPDLINEPFVDSIVAAIALKYPVHVYNYATSYTSLGRKIRSNPDPLVRAIVKIGTEPHALRLLPFVDYIVNGTYTISQLEKIASDEDAFYKLSVKTLIDLNKKKINGEHPVGVRAMEHTVRKQAMRYIRMVNELHESPDRIRFAIANSLTPQQIYYVLVNGQEEIYTSSFVGLYQRMMQRMDPPRGDKFLVSLIFDHFRKFITLSAAYNTLDPFLNTMSPQNASFLMRKFVGGLQYSEGLEDAVDVADAFGSIRDTALLKSLQKEVNENYREMVQQNNKRGKVIYGLLASLFNTRVSSAKDEQWSKKMAQQLNIPPIDYIPFDQLTNEKGHVYQEVFFYGDKDGFESFSSFMSSFRNSAWDIDSHKYWVTITSAKGEPITIFAKKPISDAKEDEKGMQVLQDYLEKNNINPTVFIHRGHSYHVNATIAQLQSSAKLVMLGSCGGYNSLASVLNVAPNAQIITSKQTGSMRVNEPIIRAIERNIREGKDLRWEYIWANLSQYFKRQPANYKLFQDYIPPQENMGAVFIKAYKKLMHEKAPVDTTG